MAQLDEHYDFPTVWESEKKIREKAPEVIDRIKENGGEDLLEMLGLDHCDEPQPPEPVVERRHALSRRHQTMRRR